MLKQYVELNAHKIIEAEKNVLHKLMNMLYMEKKMENLRN